MSAIHFHQRTTLTPEQYVAALTDFGPGRAKLTVCIRLSFPAIPNVRSRLPRPTVPPRRG